MNLIINGPGRSGTTLFSKLISYQQDLAWVSGWLNKFPNLPQLSTFNFLYRQQLLGYELSELSKFPKPAEAYNFWKFYISYFNSGYEPCEKEIYQLRKVINDIKKFQNKKHFVTKVTGDLRENIFDKVFTDYKLLWIERDPRVVVSSYIKQRWFYKENLEGFNEMSTRDKIQFYCDYYLKIFNQTKPKNSKIVFYEDLCDDPIKFFENLLFELDLKFTETHKNRIFKKDIKKVDWSNYKIKYTDEEVKLLNQLLSEPLDKYNYNK